MRIHPPGGCAICKQQGGDSLAKLDHQLWLVHMDCLQQWRDNMYTGTSHMHTTATSIEPAQQGNYLPGIFGGLLGGLLASLPSFAVMYFFHYMLLFLPILIPLGIYLGFRIIDGRITGAPRHRAALVFSGICTPLLVILSHIAYVHLSLSARYPIITLPDTLRSYFNPWFFAEHLLPGAAMGLLFAGLGMLVLRFIIPRPGRERPNRHTDPQAVFNQAVPLTEERESDDDPK